MRCTSCHALGVCMQTCRDDASQGRFEHPELQGDVGPSSGLVPDALPVATEATDWREFRWGVRAVSLWGCTLACGRRC